MVKGNKNYVNGRAFEYRVKCDLGRKGYYVIRSAGSHGKVDLVALGRYGALLVQCKRQGAISKSEREELVDIATGLNDDRLLYDAIIAEMKTQTRGIQYHKYDVCAQTWGEWP